MGKLNLSTTTQNNSNLESFFQQRVDQFLKTYIKTKNIIDSDAFKNMKKGVRIVNCARGGLVDE